jgi:hypothetical protein
MATIWGSGAIVGGYPAQVTVLEPIAVALEADDLGVMHQPVDHGRGHHGVAEDLAPSPELLVGGDDDAGPLIAGGHQLEEQVGRLGLEGDVADLVELCRARDRSTYADPGTMPTRGRRTG